MATVVHTDQIYAAIGQRVREARLDQGITQTQLADTLGLSRASVANVEAGRQHPPIHSVAAIAAALRVPPATLLADLLGQPSPARNPPMRNPADDMALVITHRLPLRPGLVVEISLPADLTSSDADRVSAFIQFLAFDQAPASTGDDG